MFRSKFTLFCIATACILGAVVDARCPHLEKFEAENALSQSETESRRSLLQTVNVSPAYIAAAKGIHQRFLEVTAECQLSSLQMAYNNNSVPIVKGAGVFLPAASWLRLFFHDTGTFVARKSEGGPKGGLNGSIGVNCPNNTCGDIGTATSQNITAYVSTDTCPDGTSPVSGFDFDGNTNSYCCPAGFCVARGNEQVQPRSGRTAPICLKGNRQTTELCRPENSGLLTTIQFFRARQAEFAFTEGGVKKVVSLADMIAIGASSSVQSCSRGALNLTVTLGRPDSPVADDVLPALPSPKDVVNQLHFDIFQRMGLAKSDMVTLLTGTHSVGGFRKDNSPDLTTCAYVPFDCSPSSQFGAQPFDNNVFKVACNGINGITLDPSTCSFNTKCTDASINDPNCPFQDDARAGFIDCTVNNVAYPGGYPKVGLFSDAQMCADSTTQNQMVKFAKDQALFFSSYADSYLKMSNLGPFNPATLQRLPV